MSSKIQIKRGAVSNIPTLLDGEFGYCTDTNQLYIGNNSVNKEIATKEQLDDKADQTALNATNANVTNLQTTKADKSEITGGLTYKGSCLYASLPTSGVSVGDYWYCSDGNGTAGAGNYAWNGTAWSYAGNGNNQQALQSQVDSIQDVTCDLTITVTENYNLLKPSECLYQQRLQSGATGIVSSNTRNLVTHTIPVTYGKYYSLTRLINGSRSTNRTTDTTTGIWGKINGFQADGTEVCDLMSVFHENLTYSSSVIQINRSDIVSIRTQIYIDDETETLNEAYLIANEYMLVEGDTAEEAKNKGLNSAYINGDTVISPMITRTLKHDANKADVTTVNQLSTELDNLSSSINSKNLDSFKYDENYIQNQRFIRSISNLRETSNAKDFTINITNNSGAVIKNAGIPIGLHNTVGITSANNNMPFQIYDDVFSNPTGFKFFDSDGKECPFYIESESECNYIVDKNIKVSAKTLCILSNGNLIIYNTTANRMQMSADDGATWTNICNNITTTPYRVLLADSQDNLFVAATGGQHLYKYTSADGYLAGTEVLDLEDEETCVGTILAEDRLGNLYSGTYQSTPWKAVIRKSTDHGNTWSIVFTSSDNQHVHNIYVNKNVTPNEIFIGLDGNQGVYNGSQAVKCYVSKDYGTTWTLVPVPYYNRDNAFRYVGENFYIGCGERNVLGGATLYKTSDYTNVNAYYPVLDTGQGVRDVINVIEDSDDVLIAGGCKDDTVHMNQLYLSEDRGETWKTVMIYPSTTYNYVTAGAGLRTFSRKGTQILSQTLTDYPMRFVYGNGAKTTLAIVNVGDIPTTGKTITLKTGYVASVEQMDKVLTAYENIEGKVADIRVRDGYVIDMVSNKRVLTDATEFVNAKTRIGQTSEYKHLSNANYRLKGSVNLGKLSRLDFCKGFTISMLYKKDDYTLTRDSIDTILQIGTMKLSLDNGTYPKILLYNGETLLNSVVLDGAHFYSCIDDYVRIVLTVTSDTLPVMKVYTNNNRNPEKTSTAYTIANNFSTSDFIFGDENMPNIPEFAIYNRVLSIGEIMSLTNGCNLITNNVEFY